MRALGRLVVACPHNLVRRHCGRDSRRHPKVLQWAAAALLLALVVTGLELPVLAAAAAPEGALATVKGRPHAAPDQVVRGSAANKPDRVNRGVNRHVPPSFRTRYPVATSRKKGRNDAAVTTAPAPAPVDGTGFEPGVSTEIDELRTPTTTTFQNADGTQTTEISAAPTGYQDPDGVWRDIDPAFEETTDGTWQSVGGGAPVEVGGEGLAAIEVPGGYRISWNLVGSTLTEPQVEDDTAVFESVASETDVEIQAQPAAVKETIVLGSTDSPTNFSFDLDLDGLTAIPGADGLELRDDEDIVRATIPAGTMTDAAGQTSTGVTYSLPSADVLQVDLDQDWLADPARTYPVRVDPTVLTPRQLKASTAMTVNGSGAYNGASDFETGEGIRTYLKWDLSSLANHKIFGANLSVVNYAANSCVPREVAIRDVLDNWTLNPSAYSFARSPAIGRVLDTASFAYGYVPFGASKSPCNPKASLFELGAAGRNTVQGWVDGAPNRGLAITSSYTREYKKYAGPSTVNAPTLYVTHSAFDATYKIPNPTPNPIVMQNQNGALKVTVTNKSAVAWSSGDFSLRYRVFNERGKPYSGLPNYNAATLPAVARGATTKVNATLKAMPAGMYYLDFSVVRNAPQLWFTDQQVAPVRLALRVFDVPPVVTQMYPQNGYSAPTLQPQLFAKAIDVDATPDSTTTYSFRVCTNAAMSTGCFTSGTAAAAKGWVVPAGKLSWSKQYYWNFTSAQTTSPTLTFFTDAPQPTITSHLAGASYGADERDIDPSLGNYSTASVDAAVATSGPDLTVARTYNSSDPRPDSMFGAGWSTKFDTHARAASNSVVVRLPDGQTVRFGKNSDGTFAAPRGQNLALVASGSEWRMTDQSGFTYAFSTSTGDLKTVQAPVGRPQTLTYDTSGRLDKVVSGDSGRGLKFGWNAAGQVATVSTLDAAGAVYSTWNYTYSGQALTKVCSPTGRCTSYEYGSGSHYRSAVLDSRPDSFWQLGEQTGETRAESEVAVNLGADAATYDTGVTLGGAGAIAGYPDTSAALSGSNAVRLPGGASKKSRDMSIEVWFKAASASTAMPIVGYQNKQFDGSTAPTLGVPVLYLGTDGKLRGQFADGTQAPVSSAGALTDSTWHHAVLTSVGSTTTLYVDGAKQGSKTSTINHVPFTFNQLGAAYTPSPSSWPAYGTTSKRYFRGSLDQAAVYSHGLDADEVADHYRAASTTPQLTRVLLPSGKTAAEISYDIPSDRVAEYTDQNGGAWKLGVPVVAGTSTDMRRTVTMKDPADRLYLYEYDALTGNMLRSASPNANGTRPDDTDRCSPPTAEDPRFCAPAPEDPDNIYMWDISGSDVRSMDYDQNGRPTAVYNEIGNVVSFKYDERGNATETRTCRSSSNGTPTDCSTSYTKFPDTTSGLGPLDPRWDKPLETRDGRSAGPTDNTFKTTYTYTPAGLLDTQTGPAPDAAKVDNDYSDGTEAAVGGGTVPPGLPLRSTDAYPATTTFAYYKTGDLATVTEPGGLVTRYTYDQIGRTATKTEVWGGRESVTGYSYDTDSRLVKTLDPETRDPVNDVRHQQQTTQTFDADGNVETTTVSDAAGNDPARLTRYGYDDHNRMTAVVDPLGNELAYDYDQFGNQTSMVDPSGTRTEFAYTAKNKLSEVRLRDPDSDGKDGYLITAAYAYDAAGRLALTYDAMGRRVAIDYFDDDLVAKKTLTTFRRPGEDADTPYVLEQFGYDKAGNVLTERTGNGTRLTQYTRDEYGRIKTRVTGTSPLTRRETYSYDRVGNITAVATTGDRSNVSWQTTDDSTVNYTYDAAGRQTAQSLALPGGQSAVTTTGYDEKGNVVRVVPPRGNAAGADPSAFAITYAYDAAGRQVETAAPATKREVYGSSPQTAKATEIAGYDTFGGVVAVRDPEGQVSRAAYDTRGQVVSESRPTYTAPGTTATTTPTTTYAYDANGNLTGQTDPRGSTTRYDYDRLGRLTRLDEPASTDAERAVTAYTYTRTGEVASVVGPEGQRTEHTYDDLDRQVTETVFDSVPTADTFTTSFRYDDDNNVTAITSPTGNQTLSTYDGLGQLTTLTDPNGVVTRFGYDGAGRQVRTEDGLRRASRTDFDIAGRMTAQTELDANGNVGSRQTYEYDPDGNLTKSTPATGAATTYRYDANGRMTEQTEPVDNATTLTTGFGYDLDGRRTRYTDGRGNPTWYTHSPMGPESVIEPSTTAHPALTDRRWQVSYDAGGLPTTLSAPGGVTRTRTFDAAGRLSTETGDGAEAATTTRQMSWDKSDRLTASRTPAGVDNYAYNARDLLVSANGPSGSASIGYDRDSNMLSRSDASGEARFSYTGGRLSGITDAATGAALAMTYDAAGAPTGVDYGSGRKRSFTYDAFGRLAEDRMGNTAANTVTSTAYTYDDRDRVTGKKTTGVAGASTNTYTYDQASRMTSWSVTGGATTTYGWDASGNRTKVNGTAARYDERNRLVSDGTTDMSYTPRGTLRSRTTGSKTETQTFDAFDRMVARGTRTYAYDSQDRLASVSGSAMKYSGTGNDPVAAGSTLFGRAPGGAVISEATGSTRRLLMADQHGDVTTGFDPADTTLSSMAQSRSFDPWGNPTAATGVGSSLGFQGAWTDPSNGQVDMKARWYDPQSGTFASRDSVDYASGPSAFANKYLYGAANPVTMVDPDGHWPSCSWCSAIGDAAKSAASAIGHAASAAWNYTKSAVSKAYGYAKAAAGAVVSAAKYLYNKARAAIGYVVGAVSSAVSWASDRISDGIDWARRKAAEAAAAAHRAAVAVTEKTKAAIAYAAKNNPVAIIAKAVAPVYAGMARMVSAVANAPARIVQATIDVVKVTSRQVQAVYNTAVRAAGNVVQSVSTAVSAAGEWAQNNWKTIASVAVGVVATSACVALTAGAGTPACALFGTAVAGALGGVLECRPGRSVAACAGSGAVEAMVAPVTETVECLSDPTVAGCASAALSVAPGAAGRAAGKYLKQTRGALDGQAAAVTIGGGRAANSGRTLFHYTDEAGLKGIRESGRLNPSLRSVNPSDARYGNGQYLSDIAPGTKTGAQLSRAFLGQPFQGQRFTHFLELNVDGLEVVQGRPGVFVVPGESPLDITGRTVGYGAN